MFMFNVHDSNNILMEVKVLLTKDYKFSASWIILLILSRVKHSLSRLDNDWHILAQQTKNRTALFQGTLTKKRVHWIYVTESWRMSRTWSKHISALGIGDKVYASILYTMSQIKLLYLIAIYLYYWAEWVISDVDTQM